MPKHNVILGSFSALVLLAALTVAQTRQPKHEPDVLYVPTTEEAVKAMLKLASAALVLSGPIKKAPSPPIGLKA